jgi:DNA repair exonuclease SbcCD nuclease subunit
VHSGDLFHTSKPSNKAISVVVENFLKLEKAGIKVIVIA